MVGNTQNKRLKINFNFENGNTQKKKFTAWESRWCPYFCGKRVRYYHAIKKFQCLRCKRFFTLKMLTEDISGKKCVLP